jgi:aryl-alcohol dehydrogenase-like predicted oxidoreductase
MKYTHLGRTGLLVSRLCLGTMNFRGPDQEDAGHRIMDGALDNGLNFFDTANVYGDGGGTESIIGRWFAQGDGRREKVVLATKVYGRMGEWPNFSKLSALHIKKACEESLRRLQTDYIDIYQMHHIDRESPWDEVWQAMEQLVQEGKVVYVASSNFAGWNIAQANERAAARTFLGLVSEQCLYNLLQRTVEMEVLPACRAYGLGVIAWSPLASGILAGDLERAGDGRRAEEWVQRRTAENRPKLEAFGQLSAKLGQKPANIALAWLLAQPGFTAPIIGPRTVTQFEDSLAALEIELSAETLERLDQIFPGPGGEAPEAFAW